MKLLRQIAICCIIVMLPHGVAAEKSRVLFPLTKETGSITVGPECDAVLIEEVLYILHDGIYTYRIGDLEPSLLVSQMDLITQLGVDEKDFSSLAFVQGSEVLRLLCKQDGRICTWDGINSWICDVQLDWEVYLDRTNDLSHKVIQIWQPTIIDVNGRDMLYMLVENPDDIALCDLACFDLENGRHSLLPPRNLHCFVPYSANSIVAICENFLSPTNMDIVEIDKTTGAVIKTLCTDLHDATGLAYDASSDIFYCISEGKLVSIQNEKKGDPIVTLLTDWEISGRTGFLLEGIEYAISMSSGFHLLPLQQNDSVRTLTFGNFVAETSLLNAFSREHPDISVRILERNWDEKRIIDSLLSRDNTADIFVTSVPGSFIPLRDKQYTASLSNSTLLSEIASAMYPQIRELIYLNGDLIAFPVEMNTYFWSVDLGAMTRLHLNNPPDTFGGWLELIPHIREMCADDDSMYDVCPTWFDRTQMLRYILTQYVCEYEREGELLQFNNEALAAVLESIISMPMELNVHKIQNSNADVFGGEEEFIPTFDPLVSALEEGSYRNQFSQVKLTAPPVFEQGKEPAVRASLLLYIINPYSTNMDLAVQFLEYIAANIDPKVMYLLRPDLEEPLLNNERVKEAEYLTRELADIEEAQCKAQGDDAIALKDAAELVSKRLAEVQRKQYRLSPDDIAQYRELAPFITFTPYTLVNRSDVLELNDDNGLFARFLAKQIDVHTFLREADARMRMVFYEK